MASVALHLRRNSRVIPLGFIHSNPEFIMAHGKRTTHHDESCSEHDTEQRAGTWHDENTPAWFKQKCSDWDKIHPLQTGSSRFDFNKNRPASRFASISSYKKHHVGVFTKGLNVTFWRFTKILFRRETDATQSPGIVGSAGRERGNYRNLFLPRNRTTKQK